MYSTFTLHSSNMSMYDDPQALQKDENKSSDFAQGTFSSLSSGRWVGCV